MGNNQFFRASVEADSGQATPFDRSHSPVFFADLHMPVRESAAAAGREGPIYARAAIAEAHVPTRQESVDSTVQKNMVRAYSDVKTSWAAAEGKKDPDPPNWLVATIELAGFAVLARIGFKHWSKNGVTIGEEAIKAAKAAAGSTAKAGEPGAQTAKGLTEIALTRNTGTSAQSTALPHIRIRERDQRFIQ